MPWDLTGNSGIKPTTNFLGTKDNQPLAIRTNNTEKVRVTPTGDVGIGTATPSAKLHLMGGGLRWANPGSAGSVLSTDQGGSIELGADNSAPGVGTPTSTSTSAVLPRTSTRGSSTTPMACSRSRLPRG